jgi:hypothetical protein
MAVARLLADSVGSPSQDAQLRRAVSTAYYALFHTVVRSAAQRFVGPDNESSAGYRLLYRSFDHGHMRRMCEALEVSTLSDRMKYQLRRNSVSQDMRDFASSFATHQKNRHLADYDPWPDFLVSDIASLVDEADNAMAAFENASADEQTDVLALLMVKVRSD